jgi:hypothetical protein
MGSILATPVSPNINETVFDSFDAPDDIILSIVQFADDATLNNYMLVNSEYYRLIRNYRYATVEIDDGTKKTEVQLFRKNNGAYYLPLPSVDNYSSYKCPSRHLGVNVGKFGKRNSNVLTTWRAIRIDPKTLFVHTGDFTYATSTGFYSHHGLEYGGKVPYASAFDCEGLNSSFGVAHVDLQGTPFAVDTAFEHAGCNSHGRSNFSVNDQFVVLEGGGFCGWICPRLADNETKATQGGWFLKLKLV